MDTKVKKRELIKILHDNRTSHAAAYQLAMEKYREKMMAWFNASVDTLKAGGWPEKTVNLPTPEEHTRDFDRAIRMLEMNVADEIELEEHEFNQYVMNEWSWHRAFLANTSSYLG